MVWWVAFSGSQLITCGAVEFWEQQQQQERRAGASAPSTLRAQLARLQLLFSPFSLFQPTLAGAGARSRTARRVQGTAPLGRERSKQAAVVWFTGRGTGLPTGGRALPAWAGDSAGWRLQPGVVGSTSKSAQSKRPRRDHEPLSRSLDLRLPCTHRAFYLLHADYGLRTPATFPFSPPTLP